mmetsp:Transcript_25894/g.65592  ORF Transcript_25894/g.65592 Transcript_25894/m.65592 type:complete len:212 (+) Transcript_25894:1662-2297(+)
MGTKWKGEVRGQDKRREERESGGKHMYIWNMCKHVYLYSDGSVRKDHIRERAVATRGEAEREIHALYLVHHDGLHLTQSSPTSSITSSRMLTFGRTTSAHRLPLACLPFSIALASFEHFTTALVHFYFLYCIDGEHSSHPSSPHTFRQTLRYLRIYTLCAYCHAHYLQYHIAIRLVQLEAERWLDQPHIIPPFQHSTLEGLLYFMLKPCHR